MVMLINVAVKAKKTYRAYLAIFSVDYISTSGSLDRIVKVHSIKVEEPVGMGQGYGFRETTDLAFRPTSIALNNSERSFVLYGAKNIMVGPLPSTFESLRHEKFENSPDADLCKPA
jgi:hypothetical protein